jgi:YHS domain-containing protein
VRRIAVLNFHDKESVMIRRLFFAIATAALVFGATAAPAPAQAGAVNTIGSKGVAIRGYDPVAYFTEGKPRKGSAEFAAQYQGAAWHFASAAHKALFEANPAKYAPAYGGFCAYGVAQGYLVKIEPDAWAIRDGTLYLNYDRGVQRSWNRSPAAYIAQADAKWPGLAGK